jgi:hypothetical protein
MNMLSNANLAKAETAKAPAPARVGKYLAVFTAPPKQIPSRFAVDAPLLGNGDTLVALGGGPAKLQFYINKNDLWVMKRKMGSHPVPLARLDLDVPELQGASYRIEQDLLRGITTGRFEKDGKTLTIETAVAATENLLWIKLSAKGGAIAGRASLCLPGSDTSAGGDAPEVQAVERRFEKNVMIPAGAACAVRVVGGKGAFTVKPGKPVMLVAVVCSRFDAKDFRAAAVQRAAAFAKKDLRAMKASHEAWWRNFWSKSFVEIPDKVLEQRYYLSHYVMASASRVPDFPPGLYGWVIEDNLLWDGAYVLNYNLYAPFYGLYAANHIEQADPCTTPLMAAMKRGREWSIRECNLTDAILLPCSIGPMGSGGAPATYGQKNNSAYACVAVLAPRWHATYDLDYARKIHPFVHDTARFWEQWLKWEKGPGGGRYVTQKDACHEQSGDDTNAATTLAMVRRTMELALDLSRKLRVDAKRREKWEHIREHLAPFPTCTVRDLPKKFWPKHLPQTDETLNLPIFRYTERGTPWWEDNTVGIQHIYPAGGIGLDSPPELLERARNQIKVMNRWIDFNGMNSFYAAAARVGYDPRIILKEMRAMLDKLALPNGMIAGNPHGMEHQSIVPNAIQEMLLQSHEGVLRFFPCWPRNMNARFGTLRARGAFLVSAELKKGKVCKVQIVSEKGMPCTVVNPWPGKEIQVVRNGKNAETISGERFIMKTRVNEAIELRPRMNSPRRQRVFDARATED